MIRDEHLGAIYSQRMTRREASAYLRAVHGISRTVATLAKLATTGGGPSFRRVGARHVLYDRAALDEWAESLIGPPRASTSQIAQ